MWAFDASVIPLLGRRELGPVNDPRLEDLLGKLPFAWERDQAQAAKEFFLALRPAVPARLARALWLYWRQRQPEGPLLDEPEHDLALVLHVRAFGHALTPTSAYITRLLAEQANRYAPLLPERLAWGPRAALAPQVHAALDHPIMRAWVAVAEQGPNMVLIVGDGMPEIRRQVRAAAYMTSLRINGLVQAGVTSDLVNAGLMRVEVQQPGQLAAELPPLLGAPAALPAAAIGSALGALQQLIAVLRTLERETGLVRVTEVRRPDVDSFRATVRQLAQQAGENRALLLARGPTADEDVPEAVAVIRYHRVPSGQSVWLDLSPDLLATPAYTRLLAAHQIATVQRLMIDAKLRRDYNQQESDRLQAELTDWQEATAAERRARWQETVNLDRRPDPELGVDVLLAQPEVKPTASYFQDDVPSLIGQHQDWARRMHDVVSNLQAAAGRPGATVQQMQASRFFDAAMRGLTPDESPATAQAFEQWRRDVQPMLWLEWRRHVERERIATKDLFTRHTFFRAEHHDAPDAPRLVMEALTIVDQRRSAVLSDISRGVLVVRDATDGSEPQRAEPTVGDSQGWQRLVGLAEQEAPSEEQFNEAFLDALRDDPEGLVQRVANTLAPAGTIDATGLHELLREAERVAALPQGMARAVGALRARAFLTLRECIDAAKLPRDRDQGKFPPSLEARPWLLLAIAECVAADIPYEDIPATLRFAPARPPEIDRALAEAQRLDSDFTQAWIELLARKDLDKSIPALFEALPQVQDLCNRQQLAAWLSRSGAVAARLARELERAAEDLGEESEAADAVFVKLGQVLEEVLLGQYAGGAREQAVGLVEVMAGEQLPRYGGQRE